MKDQKECEPHLSHGKKYWAWRGVCGIEFSVVRTNNRSRIGWGVVFGYMAELQSKSVGVSHLELIKFDTVWPVMRVSEHAGRRIDD